MQPITDIQHNLVRKFLQIAEVETTCSRCRTLGLGQGFAGGADHWRQEEVIPALHRSMLNACNVCWRVHLVWQA